MSNLNVTLIDVGWGDSIFIESQDENGQSHYALVDSNDTKYLRSSYIFLKRLFERKDIKLPDDKPVFEFALLSHAHSDHGQGLKRILRDFGAKYFWYPKSLEWSSLAELIRYSHQSGNVDHPQSVDETKIGLKIGDVDIEILWPPYDIDRISRTNENNNSVVIILRLGEVAFLLTGDAEKDVWNLIARKIPADTRFFKVPHHGSVNGTFDQDQTPWFSKCPSRALLGISSHVKPFSHPDQEVIDLFERHYRTYFRTDLHYHVTFQTDGTDVKVKYSHI